MRQGYKFNRLEMAGSLGDLGTLLPLAVGMILINGLKPTGLFLTLGIFYVFAGIYFGVTVPVQPMKVIGAYAVATAMLALVTPASADQLREDLAEMPDGRSTIYGVVTFGDCVGVVPFVDPEHIVLVRQYRYVQGENHRWEIPTGGVHHGETLQQAAQRELAEEAGYRAGHDDPVAPADTIPWPQRPEVRAEVTTELATNRMPILLGSIRSNCSPALRSFSPIIGAWALR